MDSIEDLLKPQSFVHIRVTQRNARKTITSIEGLNEEFDLKAILKALRKKLKCNGHLEEGVICFQGDHRRVTKDWLVEEEIKERKHIIIHGY